MVWQAGLRYRDGSRELNHLVLSRSGDRDEIIKAAADLGSPRGWQLDSIGPLVTAPAPCTDPRLIAMVKGASAVMLTTDLRPMIKVSRIFVRGLDAQFGSYPKQDVPAELAEQVFGTPGRSCYALLDGAKIDHLPQMLAGSLLDHDSLFQGKAQQELAEVAPYLVRLERESPFTRRVFTTPGALGGLWGRDGGVLLLSAAPLADIRRQLRKYTRIRDEGGKWFYYRFWEPRVFRASALQYDVATFRDFLGPIEAVLCPDRSEDAMLLFEAPPAETRT